MRTAVARHDTDVPKAKGNGTVAKSRQATKRRSRGTALVEFVLIFPMLIFLFFGTLNIGFFIYALISVQNAATMAALDTSFSTGTSGSTTTACADVLGELNMMPNVASLPATCNALPLQVTAQSVTGPDSKPASKVTVTYRTLQLIPIPGLTGQLTITRVVEMRARS